MVWYKGLSFKLRQLGFVSTLYEWIESYLICRSQKVVIKGYILFYDIVKTGVPNGSILAPLLFLIYINDIKMTCNAMLTCSLITPTYKHEAFKAINDDLLKLLLSIYDSKWLITLNTL